MPATADSSAPLKRTKIVLLGDPHVGKTSLITRFLYDTFDNTYQASIGIDFMNRTMYLEDRTVRLHLWDTPGQERFRFVIPSYIKDSPVAIIVYDVTNRASFISTGYWINEVRSYRGSDAIIMLVGNKMDHSDNRQVTIEEATHRAEELNVMFMETSARAGQNVQALFKKIAMNILGVEGQGEFSFAENQFHSALDQYAITTTRNRISKIAPITSLPPEILSRIFHLVILSQLCLVRRNIEGKILGVKYPMYPDTLTRVCSNWRRVAIGNPSLWTHIDIPLDHPLNPGLFARAKVYANRAGQLPLEIHISDPGSERERTGNWAAQGGPTVPNSSQHPIREWDDLHEYKILSSDAVSIRTLKLDLHIHYRYREIYYSILEYFFSHSKPGLLTQYIVQGVGNEWVEPNPFIEPVDTPHTIDGALLGIPSARLEELWLHTTAVRVSGLAPHWKSKMYHGLVELYLDQGIPEIPESQFVNILRSSPKLQVFHLKAVVEIGEPVSAASIGPVHLEDLRDLNITILNDEENCVRKVLQWIAPGPKPLQFAYYGGVNKTVVDLFARSNVTRFYISHSGEWPLAPALDKSSRLETVVLDGINWDLKNLSSLLDTDDGDDSDEDVERSLKDVPPSNTQIDTLCLLRFTRFGFDELQAVVGRYSVRRLIICGGKLSYQTDDGDVVSDNLRNTKTKLSSITTCPMVEYYPDSSPDSIIRNCDDWVATSLFI